MLRLFRDLLTFTSFVILIASSVFWFRGYLKYDTTGWEQDHWTPTTYTQYRFNLASANGQFWLKLTQWQLQMDVYKPEKWKTLSADTKQTFSVFRGEHMERAQWVTHSLPAPALDPKTLVKQTLAGFEYLQPAPDNGRWIAVPAWLIVTASAILPLLGWERRKREKKRYIEARASGTAYA